MVKFADRNITSSSKVGIQYTNYTVGSRIVCA